MTKNNILIILIILMSNTLWVPQGITQNNNNKPKYKQNSGQSVKPPPAIYFPKTMNQPVSLPNVPIYPGKPIFNGGEAYTNNPNSKTYIMHYKAKERPDIVLNWYKSALSPPQWKVNTVSGNMISVTDSSGAKLCVQINADVKGCKYDLFYNSGYQQN